ncbi:MAG: 4Fe-4S binding protein [Armatimonadia bacterium]
MLTAEQVKEYARQVGADLVGIASADRFADVPADRSPLSIFPDAKSIIVIGRRITRGTLRATEEGTNLGSYQMFGHSWLDGEFLAMTTFEVVSFLEDNGWEATPLFPFPPEAPAQGIAVREGQPAPNVNPDFDHAAVAAGLGEIGYCRIFLSPEFGPRQRFQLIITDAPLEADPLLEKSICGGCGQCVSVCPLDAGDPSQEEVISIAGKEMTVCAIDYSKCKICQNGASGNRYHPSGKPDRLGALCTRTCIDLLDRSGKLGNKFEADFRQREPWALDALGNPVKVVAACVRKPCDAVCDESKDEVAS